MEKKIRINQVALEISGLNTSPFCRYATRIELNEFIDKLILKRKDCENMGYNNLSLSIKEENGIIDMSIHGDIEMTERNERIDMIVFKN